jgi:predicted transcriptional regulator
MKYLLTEEKRQDAVMSLADTLCGTPCVLAADAIIEYCSRPDISKAQIKRIVEALSKWID